jgi:hypothetical protein
VTQPIAAAFPSKARCARDPNGEHAPVLTKTKIVSQLSLPKALFGIVTCANCGEHGDFWIRLAEIEWGE